MLSHLTSTHSFSFFAWVRIRARMSASWQVYSVRVPPPRPSHCFASKTVRTGYARPEPGVFGGGPGGHQRLQRVQRVNSSSAGDSRSAKRALGRRARFACAPSRAFHLPTNSRAARKAVFPRPTPSASHPLLLNWTKQPLGGVDWLQPPPGSVDRHWTRQARCGVSICISGMHE